LNVQQYTFTANHLFTLNRRQVVHSTGQQMHQWRAHHVIQRCAKHLAQ